MIGHRKRREIVGTFAKMYNYRQLMACYEEMERMASRQAQDLIASLDTIEEQEEAECLKDEARENYLLLAEEQERREARRNRRSGK